MNDKEIEKEIQDKGLTAPRVMPADIEANIAREEYFTAFEGILGNELATSGTATVLPSIDQKNRSPFELLTFCVLVLKNGYTAVGKSACVSPENFNAEIGRQEARQKAVDEIWPLMGYELKQRLHEGKL